MPNPAHADQLAISYLRDQGFRAERVNGRVIVDGSVWVQVLFSTPRYYGRCFRWALPFPIVAQALLLIAAEDGAALQFFLFDPDDDVFYYHDERQKRHVTWRDDRIVQAKHAERFDALTTPIMEAALDRIELISALAVTSRTTP